ncbi:hypothetical protein [Gordonia sp. VNK21]|uniref:hypothetical protein n=1 Tax=Gordonia sp. VNK21 TaxID=3382483 RepID=UPI0038D36EDE
MMLRFRSGGAVRTATRATATVVGALLTLGTLGAGPATAAPSPTVTVIVDAAAPGTLIPDDFVGLSFEADQLHRTWTDPDRGNVAALLRTLGTGNLRFSANQVDNTAWMPDATKPVPSWTTNGQHVVPEDLSRLGRLARATGWSVDLGVNLGHFDPAAAADQAAAAHRRIGESLRSIQIGNEPNAYLLNLPQGNRRNYLPDSYVRDVRVYRAAIAAAAPGVRIEGPDLAAGSVGVPAVDPVMWSQVVAPWLDAYVDAFGDRSRYLNQHYYPWVNVTRLGMPAGAADAAGALPTVDRLLEPATRAKQERFLRQFAAVAHRAGLKPLLSETNSAAKEGREGVTNSFGAALWTVDYLMTAARAGVAGVNLHNQVDDCQSYPVFCFPTAAARRSDTAVVNPNYYAALMVSHVAGGRMLRTTVNGQAQVTAYGVRMPDGRITVIVNNLDPRWRGDVTVKFRGAGVTSATVQKLTGPSIHAVRGTRLAGSAVNAQGGFTARPAGLDVRRGASVQVGFARQASALLTVN